MTVAHKLRLNVTTEPLLREIGHGTWEGLLKDEIEREDPQFLRLWRERPYDVTFRGGESLRDVTERWLRFQANFHPPGPALIVTHDVLVRLAIIESRGSPRGDFWNIVSTNAAFAVFEVLNGRWDLVDPYVDAHLSGLRADTSAQAL